MRIGGSLNMHALAALSGSVDGDSARMRHFHTLSRTQQEEAIRRLAAAGQSEHVIARATMLSVEMVRRVLAA